MRNIVELNTEESVGELRNAFARAKAQGKRIRIQTDTDDRGVTLLKYAVGGETWTLPFYDEA